MAAAKAGSLTCAVDLVHARPTARASRRSAANSAASASGSWNGPPSTGDRRDAAQRHEQRDRAGRRRQLGAQPPAQLGALLRRRAHQRDARVVHVEVPVRRTAPAPISRGPKLTMSSAPERDDLRHARAGRPPPAGAARRTARRRPGRRPAPSSSGRGRRRRSPASTRLLHGPPAGAGGVEDEHLVAAALQLLPRGGDRRGGDAEHGGRDDRAVPPRSTGGAVTMPAIAAAALARTRAETELSPATSVTAGISIDVADVDVGARCRRRPWSRPPAWARRPAGRAWRRWRSRCCPSRPRRARPGSAPRRTAGGRRPAPPAHIACRPPCPRSVSAARSNPPAAATSSRGTSGRVRGGPWVPTSTSRAGDPGLLEPLAEERVLRPLGVQRADEDDGRAATHGAPAAPAAQGPASTTVVARLRPAATPEPGPPGQAP